MTEEVFVKDIKIAFGKNTFQSISKLTMTIFNNNIIMFENDEDSRF